MLSGARCEIKTWILRNDRTDAKLPAKFKGESEISTAS